MAISAPAYGSVALFRGSASQPSLVFWNESNGPNHASYNTGIFQPSGQTSQLAIASAGSLCATFVSTGLSIELDLQVKRNTQLLGTLEFNGLQVPNWPSGDGSYVLSRSGTTLSWASAPSAGISDAPSNGTLYGRQNAAWVAVPAAGISDAPSNGTIYGRQNGAWVAAGSGSGSVTSVAASGGSTGLSFSGSPITTSGTLTLGGTLALASGGTGATTASGARSNLGLGNSAVLDTGTSAGTVANGDHLHDSRYVLLTGSTMSGTLKVGSGVGQVQLNPGSSSNAGYLAFFAADGTTRRGYIGWQSGSNLLQIASENGYSWSFTSVPYVGTSVMWHANNDGSSSGLDADLLDGLHASSFEAAFSKGNLVQGTGISLSGTLTSRLVGSGNVTIDLGAHATQHKSGGSDSIKLDELAAPTDVTTLNASTSAHGLLPKLPGGTSTFLRSDGTWATPPGGGLSAPVSASLHDIFVLVCTNASPLTFTWYKLVGANIA